MIANAATLTENARIPLHELQADVDYLIGRVAADGSSAPMIATSIKAKLALIETALTAAAPLLGTDGREEIARALMRSDGISEKNISFDIENSLPTYVVALRRADAVLARLRPAPPAPMGTLSKSLLRTFDATGVRLTRSGKTFTLTCESDAISNRIATELRTPADALPAPADAETIQILLDLLNPLHGELDRQTYDDRVRENSDTPDREYSVNVTARMERDLTQAVYILEDRKRQAALPAPAGWQLVPVDASEEMICAFGNAWHANGGIFGTAWDHAYAAMLVAASAPAEPKEG